jgi:hypothetical protein
MQVIGIVQYDAELEIIKLQYVAVMKTTIEFKKNLNNLADNIEQTFENSKNILY